MGGVQVRKGEVVSVKSRGEMGKDFCPNFLQPFLENIDRRSCNLGSRELIPVFHNPLLRRWLAPWSTLKGCPLRPRRASLIPKKFLSLALIFLEYTKRMYHQTMMDFHQWCGIHPGRVEPASPREKHGDVDSSLFTLLGICWATSCTILIIYFLRDVMKEELMLGRWVSIVGNSSLHFLHCKKLKGFLLPAVDDW